MARFTAFFLLALLPLAFASITPSIRTGKPKGPKGPVTVKAGEKCNGKTLICPAGTGTACNGPKGDKRCTKEMGAGQSCADPFWVCKKGLKCVGEGPARVCEEPVKEVSKGQACDGKTRICKGKLECVGDVCVVPVATVAEGKKCNGKTRVCAAGLECIGDVCAVPIVIVKPGDKCNGKTRMCPRPTACNGPAGKRRCNKLMDAGGSCADPFWICKDGLDCVGKGADRVCAEPVITVNPGDKCDGKKRVCAAPASCNGPAGKKVCTKLMDVGQSCADPFWICKEGLVCGADKKCAEPVRLIGRGKFCNGKSLKCRGRLECVGDVCVPPIRTVGRGRACDGTRRLCRARLECVGDVCVKPIRTAGLGMRCNGKVRVCEAPLVCEANQRGRTRCVKVVGVGHSCRGPVVCKKPLMCMGRGKGRKCMD